MHHVRVTANYLTKVLSMFMSLSIPMSLQKQLQLLRRLQYISLADHGDCILAGVWQHRITPAHTQLLKLLPCLVKSHEWIEEGVCASIAQNAWGSIKRAYCLVFELRARVVSSWCSAAAGIVCTWQRGDGMLMGMCLVAECVVTPITCAAHVDTCLTCTCWAHV